MKSFVEIKEGEVQENSTAYSQSQFTLIVNLVIDFFWAFSHLAKQTEN